jgi:hypothetical protein
MEGIVATRRQTLAVMDAMRIRENVGRGEQEIRNALTADEFVHGAVDGGVALDERFVREVTTSVTDCDDAGAAPSEGSDATGAPFEPPPPTDVHHSLRLCKRSLSESVHPVLKPLDSRPVH